MDRILYLTQNSSTSNHPASAPLNLADDEVIDIEEAHYMERYKLMLRFSNGMKRVVDFEPFLTTSTNPLIRKYLNLSNFQNFALEYGNLHWNNYDLCFPIIDLYEGHI